ncbi:hypothetical protein AMECASPLE_032670 [Ameca splendens]|uniref:Uncharacterized protein n=1 Tax=Ameca splendens TaxID=208324 RepID=A0ABV0YI63_9TELE
MWRSSGSTPSPSRMTELLTPSLRESRPPYRGSLYPGSRSFGLDPKFMAIGEGRKVDRPVNQELRFSAQLSLSLIRGSLSFWQAELRHSTEYCAESVGGETVLARW